MTKRLSRLAPGSLVAYTAVSFFVLSFSLGMGQGSIPFSLLHTSVLITASVVFTLESFKDFTATRQLFPILFAFAIHYTLFVIKRGEFYFEPVMIWLLFPYFLVMMLGGNVVPYDIKRYRTAKVKETGTRARAVIKEAIDTGGRVTENKVYRFYRMKLTLKIEGHSKSPYEVKDTFWVSEFYIHRLSSPHSISVIIDKKDHKKVALDF